VAGAVFLVMGIQLLMMGLLGEMLVWYFNQRREGQPREYAIAEVCRASHADMLLESDN
jgi:hypothetical protein